MMMNCHRPEVRRSGSPEVPCFADSSRSTERQLTLSIFEPKDFRTSGLPDFRTISPARTLP
jgi:hypothetical protein